ncbi:hypothetical protein [Pleomorphovibrio marinus]|nr:hypothetical protein [Pleomorphovibrio marinus]
MAHLYFRNQKLKVKEKSILSNYGLKPGVRSALHVFAKGQYEVGTDWKK